jgi:hypothetical protein
VSSILRLDEDHCSVDRVLETERFNELRQVVDLPSL